MPSTLHLKNEESPLYILVLCANATMSKDYIQAERDMRGCIEGRIPWAEEYNYILLTPVIPREFSIPIYAVAFDKRVFMDSIDEFYRRPDLSVVQMVDALKKDLEDGNISVTDKVFIEGFSAGGMFAQRFSLLQPDLVKAIAVGQSGGALTLPVEEYENTRLGWPLGLYDFEELTGTSFNLDVYKEIQQFIYIGQLDNKNTTVHRGNEIWNNAQVNILNEFGVEDPERIENQVEYLNSLEFDNIYFKMYPNHDHNYYNDEINDIFDFFERNR